MLTGCFGIMKLERVKIKNKALNCLIVFLSFIISLLLWVLFSHP